MSSTRALAKQLARLDGFSGLRGRELRRIVDASSPLTIPPGEVVAREEEIADGLYVVLAGTLGVSRAGESIGTIGTGDLIGEIGLLGGRRTATVRAETPAELLHFPTPVARKLHDEVPAFRDGISRTAAKRRNRDLYTE